MFFTSVYRYEVNQTWREPVIQIASVPIVFLVERDDEHRSAMARGLRSDGMNVIEFPGSAEALRALSDSERPAVLVITPEGDGVSDGEFACLAKAAWPQTSIVFTNRLCDAPPPPPGSHVLAKPFAPSRLSRFIRLVVAKPALRGTLQSLYRQARSAGAKAVA